MTEVVRQTSSTPPPPSEIPRGRKETTAFQELGAAHPKPPGTGKGKAEWRDGIFVLPDGRVYTRKAYYDRRSSNPPVPPEADLYEDTTRDEIPAFLQDEEPQAKEAQSPEAEGQDGDSRPTLVMRVRGVAADVHARATQVIEKGRANGQRYLSDLGIGSKALTAAQRHERLRSLQGSASRSLWRRNHKLGVTTRVNDDPDGIKQTQAMKVGPHQAPKDLIRQLVKLIKSGGESQGESALIVDFNSFRDNNPGLDIELAAALRKEKIFKGSCLHGMNLNGLNLEGTTWQDVDFSEADLQGTNFSGARFLRVSFAKTNFTNANLSGVVLEGGIDFSGTILTGANCSGMKVGSFSYDFPPVLEGAINFPDHQIAETRETVVKGRSRRTTVVRMSDPEAPGKPEAPVGAWGKLKRWIKGLPGLLKKKVSQAPNTSKTDAANGPSGLDEDELDIPIEVGDVEVDDEPGPTVVD